MEAWSGWYGEITKEIENLTEQYWRKFNMGPDQYADVCYRMSPARYAAMIKLCIEKNIELGNLFYFEEDYDEEWNYLETIE